MPELPWEEERTKGALNSGHLGREAGSEVGGRGRRRRAAACRSDIKDKGSPGNFNTDA
jgi:hypothetical protein